MSLSPGKPSAPSRGIAIDFELVWDSGTTLSNVMCVESGDADLDGTFDFAGTHFAPNLIHLFEADGGTYTQIWNSAGVSPPASYVDVLFADTDSDGLGEIFGAEVSTLGKVMLFEESGDSFAFLHDTIREADASGQQRLRNLIIGDSNLNGRTEVIVIAGGSSPTNGQVSIWEQSGIVGDNTYTRIFEYSTVSYLYQAGYGDSDNDGTPEIILGLGGAGGFPLIIRRLEYDSGSSTWVHLSFTSPIVGIPLSPHVADFDGDGLNELAYGSANAGGFMVVYENTGPNSYDARFVSPESLTGTAVTLTSRTLSATGTQSLAVGSHGGDIELWTYDSELDSFIETYLFFNLGGSIYDLALDDDGNDGFEELLPAVDGSRDQVLVYRRTLLPSGLSSPPALWNGGRLAAAPNPLIEFTRIRTDLENGSFAIHDALGRVVRRLGVRAGQADWDGRDDAGRAVPRGVYSVRYQSTEGTKGESRRPPAPLRIIVR